ncbi:MAG: endolytic transglycosylase MltG [Nitrospiraceae bacterium]|nr:MAG: endolytic transglycosylase MltG [Nitrospiraceae bacterium]
MDKKSSRILQAGALILSIIVLAGIGYGIYLIMPVSSESQWKEIEIPRGASYSRGIDILVSEGIIKNPKAFLFLARLTFSDRSMKAGYYNLNTSMSPLEIFNRLRQGMIVEYTVTIPEGSDLESIRYKLEEYGLIDERSWGLVTDRDYLEFLGIDAPSLEGYIYPDTYSFAKGADPRNIFSIMVQRMREKFDDELVARAGEIGMTVNEVLTLASIIEKEAIYNSERPRIAAVYHNRLRKSMKLQADPTVLYGVKDRWKRIRYRDLRRKTPYNTYVIKGLPPGPIASPGIESIKAALYPEDVDFLFFVAMNNGRHYFSRTGEEHMEAVVVYQRNGREFPEAENSEITESDENAETRESEAENATD